MNIKHYVLPIEFGIGHPVTEENLIFVTVDQRYEIEETFEDRTSFRSHLLIFRERVNCIEILNGIYVQELTKLHNIYFKNFSRLSEPVKKKYVVSLSGIISLVNSNHNFKLDPYLSTDEQTDSTEFFWYLLSEYHKLLTKIYTS